MNKQEILDEINQTKEHLAYLKKRLEACEHERWIPQKSETYYFIDHSNNVYDTEYNPKYDYCEEMYNAYNCFKTKEEAEAEAEKILVRRMLEDIARRLNKGVEINWNEELQYKWYIAYDTFDLLTYCVCGHKVQGVIYCLDSDFLRIAIQEIGKERLEKYLRGE